MQNIQGTLRTGVPFSVFWGTYAREAEGHFGVQKKHLSSQKSAKFIFSLELSGVLCYNSLCPFKKTRQYDIGRKE